MTFTSCCQSLFVLLTLLAPVYLQISSNITQCSTQTLTTKTVYEFWHENIETCEIDIQNLLKIYQKMSINFAKANHDKINDLLHSHISSTLMETLINQLTATISTKSLNSKPEIQKWMNQLYDEQNKSFITKIWRKVLDESVLFMSDEDILQQLLWLTNSDLKLNLLEYLLTKYEDHHQENPKFLPLLTFSVASVMKQRQQAQTPIEEPVMGRLLNKLPQQLLTIFQSWNYNVSILNNHSNEYIFAQLNNTPTANKRFLFSFLPTKNYFRIKGKFQLQFNLKGQLAIGVPYNGTYNYLTAEQTSAFICLDCGINAAQWWQILSTENNSTPIDQQFVLIQNVATNELLCATSMKYEYNEDLILISTFQFDQHMLDSQCQWKFIKRNK